MYIDESCWCPHCGYPLDVEEGLTVCYGCGWFDGADDIEEEKIGE